VPGADVTEIFAELHVDCRNGLGEMPVWCPESGTLYWIDVVNPGRVFHWAGGTHKPDFCSFAHPVTGLNLAGAGNLLVHGETSLLLFNPETSRSHPIWTLPASPARMRFNDGHCDSVGRLWVGTMVNNFAEDGTAVAITGNIGQLWVVTPDGGRPIDAGFGCPNAICWSPDGGIFYVADSYNGWLYSYRFDLEAGNVTDRRPFCRLSGLGIPDGAAVDEDGYLWNARWGAGTVVRISPDGQLDRVVRLPVSQPTACCFGDRDRRTLYITTARYALDPDRLLAEPVAGGIFAIRTGVPGLELPRFQLQPVGGSLLP
jgi:sugar lactone lactonase YvrE